MGNKKKKKRRNNKASGGSGASGAATGASSNVAPTTTNASTNTRTDSTSYNNSASPQPAKSTQNDKTPKTKTTAESKSSPPAGPKKDMGPCQRCCQMTATRCGQCKTQRVFYCRSLCQIKDWELGHRIACKFGDVFQDGHEGETESVARKLPSVLLMSEQRFAQYTQVITRVDDVQDAADRCDTSSGERKGLQDTTPGLCRVDPDNDFRIKRLVDGWRGVRGGLENMGNSCFLNSVLQALQYSKYLRPYLLSRQHSKNCPLACPELTEHPCAEASGDFYGELRYVDSEGAPKDDFCVMCLLEEQVCRLNAVPCLQGTTLRRYLYRSMKQEELAAQAWELGAAHHTLPFLTPAAAPSLLLKHLPRLSRDFMFGAQEDAHEFLRAVLRGCQQSSIAQHGLELVAEQDKAEGKSANGSGGSGSGGSGSGGSGDGEANDEEAKKQDASNHKTGGGSQTDDKKETERHDYSLGRRLNRYTPRVSDMVLDYNPSAPSAHAVACKRVMGLAEACKESSFLYTVLGGTIRSDVACGNLKCGHVSHSFESFVDLSLEIRSHTDTLEETLDAFTAPERLDKQNMYKCSACSQRTRAFKRLVLTHLPNLLVVNLKRFRSMGGMGKVSKFIRFPTELDGSKWTAGPSNAGPRFPSAEQAAPVDLFRLYAVVVHLDFQGSSSFGHYVAYVRMPVRSRRDNGPSKDQPGVSGSEQNQPSAGRSAGCDGAKSNSGSDCKDPGVCGANSSPQGASAETDATDEQESGEDQLWYRFDDTRASVVSQAHVLKQPAYILFYDRTHPYMRVQTGAVQVDDGTDSAPSATQEQKTSSSDAADDKPTPCLGASCDFFGTRATEGYCSQCFRKHRPEKWAAMQAQKPPSPTSPGSSSSTGGGGYGGGMMAGGYGGGMGMGGMGMGGMGMGGMGGLPPEVMQAVMQEQDPTIRRAMLMRAYLGGLGRVPRRRGNRSEDELLEGGNSGEQLSLQRQRSVDRLRAAREDVKKDKSPSP